MQYRGLFMGLTTIDIQYFVDYYPGSNKKIKTAPPDILVGGPATNAAVAFAFLNKGALLASANGNNPYTPIIEEDFSASNIQYTDLVKSQILNPILATVITSKLNGSRNIFTHNPLRIRAELTPGELLEKTNPQIILLDGFYPEFCIELAQLSKLKSIPVVADCGSWKPQYEELLNFVDIAICSEDFFPPFCTNESDVFAYFQNKKIRQLVITRGEKNILYYSASGRGEIKIVKRKVKDTLGAGDFFHGAFCYYFIHSNDFFFSIQKAADLASCTCEHEGTRSWLKTRDRV